MTYQLISPAHPAILHWRFLGRAPCKVHAHASSTRARTKIIKKIFVKRLALIPTPIRSHGGEEKVQSFSTNFWTTSPLEAFGTGYFCNSVSLPCHLSSIACSWATRFAKSRRLSPAFEQRPRSLRRSSSRAWLLFKRPFDMIVARRKSTALGQKNEHNVTSGGFWHGLLL